MHKPAGERRGPPAKCLKGYARKARRKGRALRAFGGKRRCVAER